MEPSPLPAPELTVLIISFNTRDMTLKCLETLYAQARTPLRVVVWDNTSDDGSADAVAEHFPQVELVRSPENTGFAEGNNRAARGTTTEWLLLLNSDTEVLDHAIDRLLEFARAHPENGIYGGRTVFADGRLNNGSAMNSLTPWSSFCHATGLVTAFKNTALFDTEAIGSWQRDNVREVDIIQGSFFLIPTRLWQEFDGFDRRYWMYGEEVDLCHRMRAKGWQPVMTPDAEIIHHGGASRNSKAAKFIQVARSRATLMQLHWPRFWRPWGRAMLWLWGANRYAISAAMKAVGLKGSTERHEVWTEVWKNRNLWLNGWPKDAG
jgi:N-acetylglucosaminyl-diphospho-decaprenol L-rhamnosyltransferase